MCRFSAVITERNTFPAVRRGVSGVQRFQSWRRVRWRSRTGCAVWCASRLRSPRPCRLGTDGSRRAIVQRTTARPIEITSRSRSSRSPSRFVLRQKVKGCGHTIRARRKILGRRRFLWDAGSSIRMTMVVAIRLRLSEWQTRLRMDHVQPAASRLAEPPIPNLGKTAWLLRVEAVWPNQEGRKAEHCKTPETLRQRRSIATSAHSARMSCTSRAAEKTVAILKTG
jgi:hypothetical protein